MTELTIEQALQQGIEAHKAGRVQEADRLYTAILEAQPEHPDANHNMGVLAVSVGKFGEALPFFKHALEANPVIAQFWLSYIDTLIKSGRLTDAQTVLDQAKSKDAKGEGFDQLERLLSEKSKAEIKATNAVPATPQNPREDQVQLISNLYNNGELLEVIEQAGILAKKYPNSSSIWNILGAAAAQTGRLNEAISAFEKVVSIQPNHADGHYNLGVALKNQGKLEECIKAYNKALSLNPNNAVVLNNKGIALADYGQIENAVETYKKALVIEPGNVDAHNNLGNALKKQGLLEEAIQVYSKAISLDPDNAVIHNNIGVSFQDSGQAVKAIEAYGKALILKPDYTEAFVNMGNILKDQGELEKSIAAFKNALHTDPDYPEAYNGIAVTLHEQGKVDEAIECYKKAIVVKPDFAEAYMNMSISLQKNGQLDKALEACKMALLIKPKNPEAFNTIGNILKEQGKLNEATDSYDSAIALNAKYIDALYNKGNILKERGMLEESAEVFKTVMNINPATNEEFFNKGIALKEQGKFKEAAASFKKSKSRKSEIALLHSLYGQDDRTEFLSHLDYIIKKGDLNAVIGSYADLAQHKHGVDYKNPFCNDPLKYTVHTSLLNKCDFEGIFIGGAQKLLDDDIVQNRSQSLLTNGIQTTGNVFNQIGKKSLNIQNILRDQIEIYKETFKDSKEGFITNFPNDYKINGWLINMKSGGKLAPHMHDNGWISGSVYVNVPPKHTEDAGNFVVSLHNDTQIRSIDVVTGSLCLFPSSLLHYTIPFESEECRTVLAFDVVPSDVDTF